MKALQVATQLGSAAASRNPKAFMQARMQTGKFTVLRKGVPKGGAVKIVELINGAGVYTFIALNNFI